MSREAAFLLGGGGKSAGEEPADDEHGNDQGSGEDALLRRSASGADELEAVCAGPPVGQPYQALLPRLSTFMIAPDLCIIHCCLLKVQRTLSSAGAYAEPVELIPDADHQAHRDERPQVPDD